MSARDDALQQLQRRLQDARSAPARILDAEALRAAQALQTATGPYPDATATIALGRYRWACANAIGAGRAPDGRSAEGEVAEAVRMFSRMHGLVAGVVPQELRERVLVHLQRDPVPAADPLGLAARATALITESERSADTQPLLDALALVEAALKVVPSGHPDRYLHAGLGSDINKALYARTYTLTYLDEAIRYVREVLREIPLTHVSYAVYLTVLGSLLRSRFQATNDMSALEESLKTCREAVAITPRDDAGRAERINILARVLKFMYISTDEQSYMDERLTLLKESVSVSPPGHPNRATSVAALGDALAEMAEATGDVDRLDEALEYLREAVDTDVQSRRGGVRADSPYLYRLGTFLRVRYDLTRDFHALEESIETLRIAIAAKRPDQGAPHVELDELAASLHALYERTEELSVLEESVRISRQVLAMTPPGLLNRPRYLSTLARRLRQLYLCTKDVRVLDEAIETAQEAVDTGTEPIAYGHRLAILGSLYRVRYLHSRDESELVKAVSILRESVAAIPADHPVRQECIGELGLTLQGLSMARSDSELLREARGYSQEIADSTMVPLDMRVQSYMHLASISERLEDGEAALAAIERAVELAEVLTLDGVTEADRAHRLGELVDLPGQAASAALSAGQPSRAVELLERTRGVLAADTLNQRSGELERLRTAAPGWAADLARVRTQLSSPKLARAAYRELGALLDRIRGVPGFEGFQRPPRIEQLSRLARSGPVVMISAGLFRSDALVLTGDGNGDGPGRSAPVELVRLPDLDRVEAARQAERLAGAGRAALRRDLSPEKHRQVRDEVVDVLEWLWEVAAAPVLDHLGFTGTPPEGQEWPRLWWCPAHVLSFLPFHAAGRYRSASGGDREQGSAPSSPSPSPSPALSVLDRVVSSYTTTIGALAQRERPRRSIPATLIVPVPDTPGARLPGVVTETQALLRMVPDARPLLRPSRAGVLDALPGYQIAHFACHGHADRTDPARSHLILTDHDVAPLTLDDVSHLNLTADLAYLSACDTGIAPVRLSDQFLHFTGAFQLAGYRHVIGTLWSVDDQVAADLATAFYDRLTSGGTLPPRTDTSARALHDAIRALRARYPDDPALWAAHTHTGA
ncbi:tetratricopeptide (TPR) repeat protein [Catenulispora sp. EB89]|uniref:CHAT domain-containing protein n=1 Tax=Catenulispora sp. EB89 TaxID=3156257 RepID=UPI003514A16D